MSPKAIDLKNFEIRQKRDVKLLKNLLIDSRKDAILLGRNFCWFYILNAIAQGNNLNNIIKLLIFVRYICFCYICFFFVEQKFFSYLIAYR